ncbi:hypothetical protein B9Z38_01295 [Limnohabitans sp. MMS-10A-160]|nr:hypothetical protein B9Z43_07170 [Limnohabitans sp. MMS-10A-192]PUE26969.1 hypothetical protein B9Z38_01295 [Limnohabitans sp. MMS-10A-160]
MFFEFIIVMWCEIQSVLQNISVITQSRKFFCQAHTFMRYGHHHHSSTRGNDDGFVFHFRSSSSWK